MAKPTQKISWVPDNTTNIADPGSKATYGWLFEEAAPSAAFNWFWNRVSQWINYIDALDYLESDHTINVTFAGDPDLAIAIAEIAALPKNLNGHTLTVNIATGSYALSNSLFFSDFYNGEIVITGTGSPVLTRPGLGGFSLLVENCDKFTATGVEFNSDPGGSDANRLDSVNSVSITGCTFTNTSGVAESSALQAKNVGSCYLSGCTFTATVTGYTAVATFTNINVVGSTTITNAGSVFVGSQGGKVIYEAPSDVALLANIGMGAKGGEFIGKYNHITLVDYLVPLGTTASMIDIQPGKTLEVWNSGSTIQQAEIKVVNVVGSRIYFYSTSGETAPDSDWVGLKDSTGSVVIGSLYVTYAGVGYTTIREAI